MKKVIFLIAMTFALCTSISADVGIVRHNIELPVAVLQVPTFESSVMIFAAVPVPVLPAAEVQTISFLRQTNLIVTLTGRTEAILWIDPGRCVQVSMSNNLKFNQNYGTKILLNREIVPKLAHIQNSYKDIVLTRHV